jgi:hypothetical protein
VNLFTSWTQGQPWWVTLLLLPAMVLAAVVSRVLRYLVLVIVIAAALGVGLALWGWRRRR